MICKHFGKCGGCQLQHLSYDQQVDLKVKEVLSLFNFKEQDLDDIIASPKQIYYRNRMDYVISSDEKGIIIGLKEKGKWWKVIDLDECFLMSKEANEIKNLFKDFANKHNLSSWDLKKHKGVLRYLIIREGKFTGERMLIINTSNDYLNRGFTDSKKYAEDEQELEEKKRLQELFLEFYDLLKDHGIAVSSLIHGVNKTITDISFSSELNFLVGNDFIKEKLHNFYFRIGPNSFFQSNSYTAELMIKKLEGWIKEQDNPYLLDLFCGSGTFSLPYHKYFDKIYGVELSKESIQLYKENLKLNSISEEKFTFFTSSVEKALRNKDLRYFIEKKPLIILDPPRSGLTPKAINLIKASQVDELIYISCNPKTQKRDIDMLGFEVKMLVVVDQFPQTNHVETIALLKRKS